jgi:hypothetical protein
MTKTKLETVIEKIWLDLNSGETPESLEDFKNKYLLKSNRKKISEEIQCQCLTSNNKRCIKKIYKEALENEHYVCFQHWKLYNKHKKYLYGTFYEKTLKD